MPRSLLTLLRRRLFWLTLLLTVWLLCSGQAPAGAMALKGDQSLSDRLAAFPQWGTKPALPAAQGDLIYPDWLRGKWQLTSTLVDLAAPMAPDLVTPGFEGNRAYLGVPVTCAVQFVIAPEGARSPLGAAQRLIPAVAGLPQTVADRAFNGLSMARAYLGTAVQAVKVDSDNPNRQVTLLKGDRQLESTVTARAVEVPREAEFITVERFQQVFRGGVAVPYFNEVEITTAYRRAAASEGLSLDNRVWADQVTAVYLSPQDPNFLKAQNQPVALYRYRLELVWM
ncbi:MULTISPECIES: DUF6816 family protein [Cyanophyceae]|uniref:DUF6816 family protein n=1 Tax=Cyanophyceae TaxID=3028117 RepID=UPI0016892640|nr:MULTISPECIES: hypothetical protein [Cyanophyceae]MBD1917798.1 hypothetical protein [Phormidium sp. FACHB-77]MBD2032916.1 hypothetical protein [Phormidium sp. FACHB-322]MBD2051664.1 hypothetical protein [Leptolyngbya sp. FACHB-60]